MNPFKGYALWAMAAIALVAGLAGGFFVGEHATSAFYTPQLDQLRADKKQLMQDEQDLKVASAKLQGKAAEIAYQMGRDSVMPQIQYRDRVEVITKQLPPIRQEIVRYVSTENGPLLLSAGFRVLYDEAVDVANGANPPTGDRSERIRAADPVEAAAVGQTDIDNIAAAGTNAARLKVTQTLLASVLDGIDRYNNALEGARGSQTP